MELMTFTGGLGAQIFSAAAYFYLQGQGVPVGAEISYFRLPTHIASPGLPGDISKWPWQLGGYGLKPSDFHCPDPAGHTLVHDGDRKIALGFLGMMRPEVRARFPLVEGLREFKQELLGDRPFVCMHIRRGDYVNVATHLVSDDQFIRALRSVSRLVRDAVVISDTPLSDELSAGLASLGLNVVTLIGGDAVAAHGLMRISEVLICSNSQLSVSAAALRDPDWLTLCPSQHDGNLHSPANQLLASMRSFQLVCGFDAPLVVRHAA